MFGVFLVVDVNIAEICMQECIVGGATSALAHRLSYCLTFVVISICI